MISSLNSLHSLNSSIQFNGKTMLKVFLCQICYFHEPTIFGGKKILITITVSPPPPSFINVLIFYNTIRGSVINRYKVGYVLTTFNFLEFLKDASMYFLISSDIQLVKHLYSMNKIWVSCCFILPIYQNLFKGDRLQILQNLK